MKHYCENCNYDWKCQENISHCPACGYIDELKTEPADNEKETVK